VTTKKIKIPENKFEINMLFYFFLKHLIKTKLTENQSNNFLRIYHESLSIQWEDKVEEIAKQAEKLIGIKKDNFFSVLDRIENKKSLRLFIFSLNLYSIKGLLLAEAKLKQHVISHRLSTLPPLSLEYDKLSLLTPYSVRVNGALLSLLFFDNLDQGNNHFISELAQDYLQHLSQEAIYLKKQGIEPNQIFMLVFNESMNQSIISDSGINYEERIYKVLINEVGLQASEIEKMHDKKDASTEFDFFFTLQGRSYGIGAKKTLRERYKQFIKTSMSSDINIMIEITIGLDLNKAKAEIIRSHGTYIFLADEIYDSHQYLIDLEGIFPTSQLTKETLLSLSDSIANMGK
jgi:hypothetical protein